MMKVVELSGGVGGARMAVGLARISEVDLTIVVNVGDDEEIHGLHVSPDIDTVIYTLAEVQGPQGWGRAGDSFAVNTELARFGVDNRFLLGDLDLGLNLFRTNRLAAGEPLSAVTQQIAGAFDVAATVLPASDDRLRTELMTADGEWIGFQEYFVLRQHQDTVVNIRFAGGTEAKPAPDVIESIKEADHVLIAPSNPPLSIWPILTLSEVRQALVSHPSVIAVSPLFGGKALKGPADRVMASLELPPGNVGVVQAYEGILSTVVIDSGDRDDVEKLQDVDVVVANSRIKVPEQAERLAREILGL